METLLVTIYFGLLIALSLHGLHIPWLIYHRLRAQPAAEPKLADVDDPTLPRVTVQLPLYNEKAVVERLVESAASLRYPRHLLQIQILDDSTDETANLAQAAVAKLRERGVQITYLHRSHREGFKAGALAEGLRSATGELIALFDADFVPPADFLLRVIPCFREEEIGMVQARWGHLNEGASWLTRLQAVFLDGHFVMESETRSRAGLFLSFNGTAGVWRKTCIEEAGGWQADTLTEDLDLSYRAQLAGWKFRFLTSCVAPAELPREVNAFKSQQYRWTRGAVEVLRKLGPRFLASNLPWRIKTEFLFHLTSHLVFPGLVLLAVLAYPALSIRLESSLWKLLLLDLPLYLLGIFSVNLFYVWGQWALYPGKWARVFRIPGLLFLGTGLAVSNSLAVWEGYRGKGSEFIRTPKTGDQGTGPYRAAKSWSASLEIVLAGYLSVCILHAIRMGRWASLPFLFIFALGFGVIGVCSWLEQSSGSSHLASSRSAADKTPWTPEISA
jgi:cellulose synthase/poly-beta-1,6-N-acetylglucosamine synthase-like glycosyltransferase